MITQLLVDIGLFLIYIALFVILLAWTWQFWVIHVNKVFKDSIKWMVLEIKLPREIKKSPEAMEIILRSISQISSGGVGNWLKEYWKGAVLTPVSLEIASLEGEVHFFIRIDGKHKKFIESAIYSQYPNVEINEVEDYLKNLPLKIDHKLGKKNPPFWASEWTLSKKIKKEEYGEKKGKEIFGLKYSGDMYPIKTYKDWGLDKEQDDDFKHDPLTYVLEALGSLGKGEYFVHQLVLRDAGKWNNIYKVQSVKGKEKKEEDFKKDQTLSDLAKIEKETLVRKYSLEKIKDKEGKETEKEEVKIETIHNDDRDWGIKEQYESMDRKLSKPQFICAMRNMYIAEKPDNVLMGINLCNGYCKPFNEDGFNTFGFAPGAYGFIGIADPFEYPWQNSFGKLKPWIWEDMYGAVVGRGGTFSNGAKDPRGNNTKKFFDILLFSFGGNIRSIVITLWKTFLNPFSPVRSVSGFILSSEEIATLYHFPGAVASTVALNRIDSSKGAAPSNLPK